MDGISVLVDAQDAVMNNPNYVPGVGGATHCNQATCDVARAVNAPMGALTDSNGNPLLADLIGTSLANSASGYVEVSSAQAEQLAQQGTLVVITGPGHVATVRPSGSVGASPTGTAPFVANVGYQNGVLGLNYVFRRDVMAQVKFYTPA